MSELLPPSDPWDEVVGQPDAVAQLRAAAASPVHAYLIVGPEGSGKRAAARAFAGDLLATGLDAAGAERARRLAGAEAHPAMTVVEREGASIAKEQADEVVRQSSLAPPEGDLQVIVLVDFHLVGVAAPKLLKSIEEPPPTTVFVVLAEEITPELVTIASRCVQVDLASVPERLLAERLVLDGVAPDVAATAASGAGGSLSRARLLARDPEAAARRDAWYRAPERLDGSGAAAATVADELLGSIDGVLEPLEAQQSEELARFLAGFEAASLEPRKGDLKRLEDRHKREQRRVRVDELRSGLATLVGRYRDQLAAGGSHEDFLSAADAVQELCDGLAFNPNEGLQLRAVMVRLPPVGARH
jgi:DNA polymerase-3 subunit delta'